MRWPGSPRMRATIAGGIGGGLAALGHSWVWDLPLWEPGRFFLAVTIGAGVGLLYTSFQPPRDG